jgi:hypothetical protein
MSLDSLVKLVVTVAVFEMMVTVGLSVAVADVIAVVRTGACWHGLSWPIMYACPPPRLSCS